MDLNIYAISDGLTSLVIGSVALAIFLGSKKHSSRAFALMIFAVTLWTFNESFLTIAWSPPVELYFTRVSYFLGTIIASLFVNFFVAYPYDQRLSKKWKLFLVLCEIFFFYIILFTDFIIVSVVQITGSVIWGWVNGPLIFIFAVYFFGCWIVGLIQIFRKYKFAQQPKIKRNLKFMFWALSVGIIPPSVIDILLPMVGVFQFDWIGPLTGLVWVIIIGYSIIKYQQMSVKVVTAEAVLITMLILTFLNIFSGFSFGVYGRVGLFVAFVLLGYFLIQSLIKEALQKEQLKDLNLNLQKKVDEQTQEIKKAYEVEKQARIGLERLDENKNDFIIITQHHLRTPLAQILWYADSISNGLYGEVSSELREAISNINKSCKRLVKTLNNFLDITQMKIGMKVLSVAPTSLKNTFKTILGEFKLEIAKKQITITISEDDKSWPEVAVDSERIADVLSIIIDNAIQYNQKGGNITVSTEQKRGTFILSISNSGIGLNTDDRAQLFKQSFFRSKEAKLAQPLGMGVGLLVAKTIIQAHHGKISVESEGEGKGVKVIVQLPLV